MSYFIISYIFSIFLIISTNSASYDGPIAGNRSVFECINGAKTKPTGYDVTTSDFIKQLGYEVEDHLVETEDGHLLTLNRIPGPPNAPAVLLHHGFPATSFDWVVMGKNRALAFLLADEGYDVWLGNTRGGLYSSCHVKYTTSEYKFWNFSYHEMGVYDLPAEIKYIEEVSGKVDMYHVGHSTGATMALIMAAERPELASKFKLLVSLGPTVFLGHVKNFLPFVAQFASPIEPIVHYLMNGQILKKTLPTIIMQKFCDLNRLTNQICLFPRFATFGFDYKQVDYATVPYFLHHGFVPSAYKIAVHYAQQLVSGEFRKYDYGFLGNLKAYHGLTPPDYDLSKVLSPVGIYWGEGDFMCTEKDIEMLNSKLPNVEENYKVNHSKFNHLDFVHANDIKELLYDKVISTMKSVEDKSE